jgi:hypothetical protein
LIRYLRHNEIDKAKWDNCISGSVNELIYAYSWYLDIVSPGWDALIEGDYEAVMPLTWNRKFGICYLYGPYFAQQLGVFSIKRGLINDVSDFIGSIPEKISFAEFNLNTENGMKKDLLINKRKTFELDIGKPYNELKKNYSRSNLNNVKKALNRNIKIENSINITDIVSFYKRAYRDLGFKFLKKYHYKNFRKILESTAKNNKLESYIALTQDDIVCAMCIFLMSSNRSLIFSASDKLGKKYSAVFLLIDRFIEDHAGKNLILDFAGSNIPGIAYRNKGFGAEEKNYFTIYINNLPWIYNFILKLIKKFK